MPVPWARDCSAASPQASYTTARGRLRWQASPAVRRTNQFAIDEHTISAAPQTSPRAGSLETTQPALSACSLWHMQAYASSRCFSELMRAIRCLKRHMPETGQAILDACTLGAKLQRSTQQGILNHCAWSLARAGLSSCASNQSECH